MTRALNPGSQWQLPRCRPRRSSQKVRFCRLLMHPGALACAFVVLEAVATAPRVSPPSPKLKSLQDGKRPSKKKTSRAARLCESYFACLQASGAASAGRAGCGTHATLGAHASGRIWFGSVQEALIFSWAWPARNFATVLQHWGLKI